jgi:diguanylate cyclase (GGDEF)-like protein
MEYKFDSLTGLYTRESFDHELRQDIFMAQKQNSPVSLAILDIDNFKHLNDSKGHLVGDVVIKTIGQSIKREAGEGNFVARYGGEEYTIIFPGIEREQAFLTVERIRANIESREMYEEGEVSVNESLTVSGGVAAFPIDGQDESELFRKADGALFRAKSTGRNKINLAYEERMTPKTAHYTQTQLDRLSELAKEQGVGEAVLLREALDDLLVKYKHSFYA